MKITDLSPEKAVFTTKEILDKTSPVIYVFFDDDEDIHLVGISQLSVEHGRIISLAQALIIDPLLSNLPDLIQGYHYTRNTSSNGWIIN